MGPATSEERFPIRLRYHEGALVDVGNPTVMVPSVVFTIECGLYGFRHSDTAVVTESGCEVLTK